MTRLVRNVLASSRLFVLVAVFGTFLAAVVLTFYGAAAVVLITWEGLSRLPDLDYGRHAVENAALEFIALIDIFLLSTVLYIIALGLYELFIDADLPLPEWLLINSLDELKEKLSGVVIVLLGVNFLGDYVQNDGELGILWLGLAAASVILALAVAFKLMPRHGGTESDAAHAWHVREHRHTGGHAPPSGDARQPAESSQTPPAPDHPTRAPSGWAGAPNAGQPACADANPPASGGSPDSARVSAEAGAAGETPSQ